MSNRLTRLTLIRAAAVLAVVAPLLASAVPATAQTAEVLYERALARERSARLTPTVDLGTLRSIATNYERIVRRYPRSGYCDNALWQAAGVMLVAFDQTDDERDRARAIHYLDWLRNEYPSSSLIPGIADRLAAFVPTAEPAAVAAAASSAEEMPTVPAVVAGPAEAPTVTLAAARAPSEPLLVGPTSSASTAAEPGPDSAPAIPRACPLAPLPGEDRAHRPAETPDEPALAPGPEPVEAFVEPARTASAEPASSVPPSSEPVSSDPAPSGPVGPAAAPPALRAVRHSTLPKGDRITIELSREAPFTSVRAARPDQLVLSFSDAVADDRTREAAAAVAGVFVGSVAVSGDDGRPLELRLNLAGHPRFSTFPLYDPFRLVIDVEGDRADLPATPPVVVYRPDPLANAVPAPPTGRVGAEALAEPGPAPLLIDQPEAPASTSRGDYSLARQLGLGVSRIVIDPGHGGHDPGAQANGVSEADLVLDIATRLGKLLEGQPGFEVVLTRSTDIYIPLEERTAVANREQADLFLSIHANASRNTDTRGIETYFLSFATSEEAEAVAARENASSAQAMHILPELVKTIATSDKVAESREFASIVQTSLMGRIGTLSQTIKDLGVKQAPFVVLIGAEMPSVLAEVSFLTNRTEANLLKQAAHRQRIAQALCDAILDYQGSLKKVTTVAARGD